MPISHPYYSSDIGGVDPNVFEDFQRLNSNIRDLSEDFQEYKRHIESENLPRKLNFHEIERTLEKQLSEIDDLKRQLSRNKNPEVYEQIDHLYGYLDLLEKEVRTYTSP